jgi:hypothetical protein
LDDQVEEEMSQACSTHRKSEMTAKFYLESLNGTDNSRPLCMWEDNIKIYILKGKG